MHTIFVRRTNTGVFSMLLLGLIVAKKGAFLSIHETTSNKKRSYNPPKKQQWLKIDN